ncbi:DUF7305 domain-containing protein [Halomonas sp. BC04]|uniref:DUF7305 domain-containing protein n=1 Tax=Halomonas sp. BC04 TaxID=1403540 RepID=UPI0003ED73E4|nr:PilX N-terminal domain-containing pilus assembly protein [Halomonas sp. BC04]EWG97855.1 hypothetical protein Q427_33745 [Halomonas sp. BC04]
MPGPEKQQGAALILVLVLMSGSLMLGLSSMQGSLLNERLAGNYRSAVLAQNEAEAGLYAFNDELRAAVTQLNESQTPAPPVFANNPGNFLPSLRTAAINARNADTSADAAAALNGALVGQWSPEGQLSSGGRHRWRLMPALLEDDALLGGQIGIRILSEGFHGAAGSEAVRRVTGLVALPEIVPDRDGGLMSCEGVQVQGSGLIDSYDSREGSYGGSNAQRSNIVVGTQTEGAEVRVTGASPIYGNVAASGTFTATGSAAVHGNVRANGTATLAGGGAHIYGNVDSLGDVTISSSGTIHGDVQAAGTLNLENWHSRIEGNALVSAVNSNRTPEDQVGGTLNADSGGPQGLQPLPAVSSPEECVVPGKINLYPEYDNAVTDSSGPLDIKGSSRTIILDADGLHDPVGSLGPIDAPALHENKRVVKFDEFKLAGSANFQIGRVGTPVDMVMVVPGDISIGGGGSFQIAEGSTLTIVTESEFRLASAIVVGDEKPTRTREGKVEPILSIVSTFNDQSSNQSGVFIGGAANFYGEIVAPYSNVEVTGSGDFYGKVTGRSIEVKGAGGFHYDEAFGDMDDGGDGSTVSQLPRLQGIWVD